MLDSSRHLALHANRSVLGLRTAMRCMTCGAEMGLMQVDLPDPPAPEVAFERHTFKCSACPQLSQRLVFCRPRLPVSNLPVAAKADLPAAKLQIRRVAAERALATVAEKLRSRRMATRGSASVTMASIWQEGLEKLQSQATPIQPAASEARSAQELRSQKAALHRTETRLTTSTWAEVIEKVRTRQVAVKKRAGALSPRAEVRGCTPEAKAPPFSRSGKSDQ